MAGDVATDTRVQPNPQQFLILQTTKGKTKDTCIQSERAYFGHSFIFSKQSLKCRTDRLLCDKVKDLKRLLFQ